MGLLNGIRNSKISAGEIIQQWADNDLTAARTGSKANPKKL
jgi:hypothetical protein